MANLCIIPARGGSKRIPRKNIKEFLGKPIIAYSIEAALKSGLFKEVMVSTDDEDIKKIAIKYGAKVPFLRSEKNSDDYATTLDVLREVITEYANNKIHFDNLCCIYATAPFVEAQTLKNSFEVFRDNKFDTLFPVLRYGYPIQRSLNMKEGRVFFNWPENANKRSQDLPASYYDAGQFYWLKKEALQLNSIMTNNSGSIHISELEAQDIDTLVDWNMAELKYSLMHERISK
ncbi:pseudaminic acid cytidylyltransferase [Parapedobacter pyrenivorans]|uniref:Pseudaminic acid cytidylyltransferase n=1 Tax=Parapedobacter pyrenivorans TaxID=1305674 RepID=A0A917M7J9_9SPHI|nr:pseudaminic acid cytidylyltransferase [Parapedobacter pyrenivorans]GGG80083.1 pseudaminic acid cytidylyltransferase [Parapedobacter pyrenivorans]